MNRRVGRREFVGGTVKLAVAAALAPDALQAAGRQRLGAAERRGLRAAVDTIIPAEGRMPPASAVDSVAYLEGMATRDAAFRASLTAGLAALEARSRDSVGRPFADSGAAQQAECLAYIEKADAPAGFVPTLRDAVYEAYYSSPAVWKLIGYRFRSGPRRTAPLEPFDPQKVARVRGLGRLYREPA